MFRTQKNFLPAQQAIMARRFCEAAMMETIVSSTRDTASNTDSRALVSSSLNETITIFGEDGAAEFIGSGFHVQAAGRR